MQNNQIALVQRKSKLAKAKDFVSSNYVKLGAVSSVALMSVGAHAEDAPQVTLPTISISNMVGFCGVLVTAVATVATANLLIPMTAKGIKSIRAAF